MAPGALAAAFASLLSSLSYGLLSSISEEEWEAQGLSRRLAGLAAAVHAAQQRQRQAAAAVAAAAGEGGRASAAAAASEAAAGGGRMIPLSSLLFEFSNPTPQNLRHVYGPRSSSPSRHVLYRTSVNSQGSLDMHLARWESYRHTEPLNDCGFWLPSSCIPPHLVGSRDAVLHIASIASQRAMIASREHRYASRT